MNSSSVPALARRPRSASRSSWRRRIWRGEADHVAAVVPLEVGHQQHGALVPRDRAQRVEVGLQLEVAVAALPGRHRVAVDGVHVDVDGQQVVAALGAVLGDLVQEVRGGQPLALQPALHVGDRQQHGVDRAVRDGLLSSSSVTAANVRRSASAARYRRMSVHRLRH